MVGYDPGFPDRVKPGDMIIAGKNFAIGHMHPQFYYSLIGAGVSAVIADSTGRRFYRDAINAGLPVLAPSGITDWVQEDDELVLDLNSGILDNVTRSQRILLPAVPLVILEILAAGGLVSYLKQEKNKR
jgi:3-isopropylmalate dehydratase small subunit